MLEIIIVILVVISLAKSKEAIGNLFGLLLSFVNWFVGLFSNKANVDKVKSVAGHMTYSGGKFIDTVDKAIVVTSIVANNQVNEFMESIISEEMKGMNIDQIIEADKAKSAGKTQPKVDMNEYVHKSELEIMIAKAVQEAIANK